MDPFALMSTRCSTCFAELPSGQTCSRCHGQPGSIALALPPGTPLCGRYRIGRVLAEIRSTLVYPAWDEHLGTRVAIKEFFPRALVDRGSHGTMVEPHAEDKPSFDYALGEFLDEARTRARFDHPNLVRVRDFLRENGTGYVVMDYHDGESLAAYLEKQPDSRLDEDLAVRFMLPVLDGLRSVHAQGILHRELDPHTIYLSTQGRALLDLGADAMVAGKRSRSLSVVLSPGYSAPEAYLSSGRLGPWTDVYACAAILYRMVTGQVPVDAASRLAGEELPPAHELNPEVSPRLSDALQRGMALKPEERPQSAEEFQQLLHGERRTPPLPPQ